VLICFVITYYVVCNTVCLLYMESHAPFKNTTSSIGKKR